MVANIKALAPWDLTLYSTGTIVSEETVPPVFRADTLYPEDRGSSNFLWTTDICITQYHAPDHLNLIM
jgi:hypothetical protein